MFTDGLLAQTPQLNAGSALVRNLTVELSLPNREHVIHMGVGYRTANVDGAEKEPPASKARSKDLLSGKVGCAGT